MLKIVGRVKLKWLGHDNRLTSMLANYILQGSVVGSSKSGARFRGADEHTPNYANLSLVILIQYT